MLDRLHNSDLTAIVPTDIQLVDSFPPEGPKEVPFTELNNPDGGIVLSLSVLYPVTIYHCSTPFLTRLSVSLLRE